LGGASYTALLTLTGGVMKIYLITNLVNGKQYVGQTIKTIEKRWKQHLRDIKRGTSPHLYRAITKYGVDGFSIQELHSAISQEELDFAEILYIALLNCKSPLGYNLTYGGSTGAAHAGHKHSEETKRILKARFTGEGNANFGKHKSEETKNKISDSNKKSRPWNHGPTGYQKYKCRCEVCLGWHRKHYQLKEPHEVTAETRLKMRNAKLGTHPTPETKKKMSESQKLRQLHGKYKSGTKRWARA
jgi:group I intron endonuclease